jgi:simple sugar transport system ATP-binding protein
MHPLLYIERVSMHFGEVLALEDVSMAVDAGRVTCLVGDNGAGKSTLIRILSGVHRPTSGRYLVDGAAVTYGSPAEALDDGIATVHQDLGLIPLMSVWRNFVLGREPTRGRRPFRRLDIARSRQLAEQGLSALGVNIRDVDQTVGTLSGGERQAIAIARAIHFGARVLILDEPTAALGVKQTALVLSAITRARDQGLGVVFITHNPQQAISVGDRFLVLRQGRVEGRFDAGEASVEALVRLMGGG